jgi:hypothetical protein
VDPTDDSVTGRMKYLVYQRRKNLEFTKDMIALRYGADKDYDPSETIKQMTDWFWPKDADDMDMETASKIFELADEVKKTLRFKEGKLNIS